jgi:hypothetical protein
MIVRNFKEIRRDGKTIAENMTTGQMIALGWSPDKVSSAQWEFDGHVVEYRTEHSILCKIVEGRELVAVIEKLDDEGLTGKLLIINADGSCRHVIPNVQRIGGKDESGKFCWFETVASKVLGRFAAAFRRNSDSSMFLLEINGMNGSTVQEHPMR